MKIILDEKLEDWPSSRESGILTTDHNLSIDIPPNPSPVTSSALSKTLDAISLPQCSISSALHLSSPLNFNLSLALFQLQT